MAVFTTKAAGNWSASGQTTWTQVGVPGDGDTITQNHNLNVDVDITIGSSPSTGGTPAITAGAYPGPTLTIKAGKTLRCRGDLVANSAESLTVIQEPGSSFILDPAAGQTYKVDLSSYFIYWYCNGTSGSRCTFKTDLSRGGSAGYMVLGAGRGGMITATYTDFINLGDATHFGVCYFAVAGFEPAHSVTHCTFTASSYTSGTDATWDLNYTFSDNYFITSVIKTANNASVDISFGGSPSTGVRTVARNSFDQGLYGKNLGCAMVDNLIATGASSAILILTGSSWTGDSFFSGNCLVRSDSGASAVNLYGSHKDTYLVMNHAGDVHGLAIPTTMTTVAITGMIAENTTSGGFGGMILNAGPTATCTIAIKSCLLLPNPDGNAGEFYWDGSGTSTPRLTAEHNTIQSAAGQTGAFGLNEGGATNSQPGTVLSVRGNLIWSPAASTKVWAFQDGSTSPATNALVAPGASYNGFWNPSSGTCTISGTPTSTPGYNGLVLTNGALDRTHDVTGDPSFVDRTRNFVAWGGHKGATATVAGTLAYLANPANGTLDTLLADLRGWVRAGFRPQNAAFKGASYSGDALATDAAGNAWSTATPDIGAMAVVSAGNVGGPGMMLGF